MSMAVPPPDYMLLLPGETPTSFVREYQNATRHSGISRIDWFAGMCSISQYEALDRLNNEGFDLNLAWQQYNREYEQDEEFEYSAFDSYGDFGEAKPTKTESEIFQEELSAL